MTANQDFSAYLGSIVDIYAQWWKPYASFMDEINGELPWFGFELNSKTQEPTQSGKEPREKTQLVLQAIADYAHEKILIVGSPGAGKSTLLARILWEAAKKAQQDETAPIPVLVELKIYRESKIWEVIQTALETYNLYLETSEIKQLVKDKRLLLLADGFNELPPDGARADFKKFCGRNIPVIVTSRDASDSLGLERKLELQPPSDQQVARFLEERLPDSNRAQLQQLGDRVKDLEQTPLMIWMLYSIFRAKQELPETRGEAYRAFTTLYAERAKEGIDLTESRFILSKLAFEMMQSLNPDDPTDFRLDISEVEAQTFLGSEKVLRHLVNNHLLQWQGKPGNRKVRFCHQSLQEYYAAEFLLSEKLLKELKEPSEQNNKILKQEYLNYLKWTEAIALMLGLADERLAIRVVELAIGVDLMLGAQLAGKVKPQLQGRTMGSVEAEIVPEWLKTEILGRTRSARAIPGLLKLMESSDQGGGMGAATALSNIGSAEAIPGLLKLMENSNPSVRWIAAHAVGSIKSAEAIPGLLKLMENSHYDDMYVIAADAVGRISSAEAIPGLLKLMENSNHSVSQSAANALRDIGSAEAIPGLIKLIKNSNVRWKASNVRWKAGYVLGRISSAEAIPELLQLMENPDPNMRRRVAEVLGNIGTTEVMPVLLKLMEDIDASVRVSVAAALGNIGTVDAVLDLLKLTEDFNPSVRGRAAFALGAIGSIDAVPGLLKLTEDSDSSVRGSTASALGAIGSIDAVPGLLKLTEDSDSSVRGSTASALGAIGSTDAVPGLIKLMEDSDSNVRWSVASALGAIGSIDIDAVLGLLNLMKDSDFSVRRSTASALGEIGSVDAIPGLLKLIESPNSYICGNAASALGAIGSVNAIPGLLKLIKNLDPFVFRSAAEALGKIAETAIDTIAPYLPYLLILIPTKSGEASHNAIATIQSRCQFYNYEIFQAAQATEATTQSAEDLIHDKLNAIAQGVQKMSDVPKYSFPNAQKVQIIEQIETYNENNYATDPEARQALEDLQQTIENLQRQYPQATEIEAANIIDAEFTTIQTTQPRRWQNFLKVKRLWNGVKKGSLKVGEHYAEETAWGKGFIGLLEGITDEVE